MANAHKMEVVKIMTTPEELRKIADKLEEKEKTIKIGDDTTADVIIDGTLIIEFRVYPSTHKARTKKT
jgi:hypothetical protein